MSRRRGRPGLVGTMARTAVIAGTAQTVAGGVQQRQMAEMAEQQEAASTKAQLAEMQAQLAQTQPAPPPAPTGDFLAQLQQLADLKAAGMLSDDEFAAAKAKLLS